MPPCTMGKSVCSGPSGSSSGSCSKRTRQRSSQRSVRWYASVATSRLLCPGGHWSKAMMTSAPSARSIPITRSGVNRWRLPSMWL